MVTSRRRRPRSAWAAIPLAIATALSSCSAPVEALPRTSCGTSTIRLLRITDRSAPGGSRPVWIDTPAVSNPAALPVLYWLHGYPGLATDIETRAHAAQVLSAQRCRGAQPFILVSPFGGAAGRTDTEWADSASGDFDVETFVTRTLVAAVEGNHRRPSRLRGIAGYSMGGFGAVVLALRHRDLYGSAASVSGYYTVDDPGHVFGEDSADHDPQQLVTRASGLPVLLTSGSPTPDPLFAGQPQQYASRLRAAGARVTVASASGDHSWAFVRAVLPAVLTYFAREWRAAQ